MNRVFRTLVDLISSPRLVEFDYRDAQGFHHGRCYIRCLWVGSERIERILSSYGYKNIRIA